MYRILCVALAALAIALAAMVFRWSDPASIGDRSVVYIDRLTGDVWVAQYGVHGTAKWKITDNITEDMARQQAPSK